VFGYVQKLGGWARRHGPEFVLNAVAGELLKGMDKATGILKRGTELPRSNGSTTATLSDMGLSKNQSSKYQQQLTVLTHRLHANYRDRKSWCNYLI
jgi:hypothetical protein